jgi:hypothetical protein
VQTPRLLPYLSLALTRILSFEFTAPITVPEVDFTYYFSFTRLPLETPLLLDTLRLSTTYKQNSVVSALFRLLFPHVNPLSFVYNLQGRHPSRGIWTMLANVPFTAISASWTRLESLSFTGGIPIRDLGAASAGQPKLLACLPSPNMGRRRDLRLDLKSLICEQLYRTPGRFHKVFSINSVLFGLDEMQERSITLVVRDEGERAEVEMGLEQLKERWRGLFVVLVETKGDPTARLSPLSLSRSPF